MKYQELAVASAITEAHKRLIALGWNFSCADIGKMAKNILDEIYQDDPHVSGGNYTPPTRPKPSKY